MCIHNAVCYFFSYALFAIYYELNLLNVSEEIRYFYSVNDDNTINDDIYRNILAKL